MKCFNVAASARGGVLLVCLNENVVHEFCDVCAVERKRADPGVFFV